MGACGRALARAHRREGKPAPTADEILESYNRQNLNTYEDDDGNRAKLAADQARWQASNPAKGGDGYDPQKLLPLVRQYVTASIRETVRRTNRSAYSDEHLAVALYVVEVAATRKHRTPRHQFTVGNNLIVTMMARVGVALEGTDDAQRRKLAAVKQALVLAGLAVWVDETYNHGRCKRMALGPNHPRHRQNLPFEIVTTKPPRRAKCGRSPIPMVDKRVEASA